MSSLSVPLPVEIVIKSVLSEAEVSFVAVVVLDCGSVTERSSRNLWTDSVQDGQYKNYQNSGYQAAVNLEY